MTDLLLRAFDVVVDFMTQIAGGRGGIDHNIVQFVVAAIFWSILLAFALERRREDDPARERLLAWGFALGLARELFMLGLAFVLALGLVDHDRLHVVFPPLEHALSNAAVFFVAGAFLLFLLERPSLAGRFLAWSLGSLAACYLATFWWWGQYITANPLSKFGQTWCDWLFRINACIWLLVALYLVARGRTGWLRRVVVSALLLFFMTEFLKLFDMALGETHEGLFTPVRHTFYLLGIFLLGAVYVREQSADRKRAKAEILHLALHDPLTGLSNRILFQDRLELTMEQARRSGTRMALLFLDLDRFKRINDTHGHACGDLLLKAVSSRLRGLVRQGDTIARMGGDEFVLLLPWLQEPEDGITVAGKILDAMSRPFELEGRKIATSTSIGIAFYPDDGDTADELLRHADMAMYAAKGEGRGCFHLFSEEIRSRIMKRHTLEDALRRALQQDQLYLVYQPQVDIASGCVLGVEALVRWQHPEQGVILPGQFIPLAEETGLILQLGEWVLREACLQLGKWQRSGMPPLQMAVNVSPVQFKHAEFVAAIDRILEQTGIVPSLVELEMTETALMAPSTVDTLVQLKKRGMHLAIDDFGTGYSSLSYLKQFPIDRIKIDRSFVSGITSDPSDFMIVRTILAMAANLNLEALAEGVETEAQLRLLKELQCHQVQGYYLGQPLSADDLFLRLTAPASVTAAAGPGAPIPFS